MMKTVGLATLHESVADKAIVRIGVPVVLSHSCIASRRCRQTAESGFSRLSIVPPQHRRDGYLLLIRCPGVSARCPAQ